MLRNLLAEQEQRADVQIYHLVPRLDRVILGRRAPGCARVIHQNVHPAELLDRFVSEPLDVFVPGIIRCDPLRLDTETGKMHLGLFQVRRLARRNQDPSPLLA